MTQVIKKPLISLHDLINKDADMIVASGNDKPELIRKLLHDNLKSFDEVTIDFERVRSLSPSFAFEVFAKVFDTPEELSRLSERLHFVNDERELGSRVRDAIERRLKILRPTG